MTVNTDHQTIELHGHRLAYRMAGSGPVLLLIHGMAGTNAVWDEVFPELTTDHTVIAPDLPGHGASGAPAGDYSLWRHGRQPARSLARARARGCDGDRPLARWRCRDA